MIPVGLMVPLAVVALALMAWCYCGSAGSPVEGKTPRPPS